MKLFTPFPKKTCSLSRISYAAFSLPVLFLGGAFALPVVAHANYTVSPLIIDHTSEARAIEHNDIVITNNSPAVLTLFPAVNNVILGSSGGVESFVSPSMTDRTKTLSSWLEISRKPIELRPGERATTTLTLRVNPDAENGTYHALVSFPNGRNRDEAEALITNGAVPGTMVSVTIDKKVREEIGITGFRVDRFVYSSQNDAIRYMVKNDGETDMVPTGDILIYNQRGEEVGAVPVNPDKIVVKPGEKSVFTAEAPTRGLMGKYKAYLSLRYGTDTKAQLQDTAYFFVVPWQKTLLLFIGIILGALLISLFFYRRYGDDELYDDEDIPPPDRVLLTVRDGVSKPIHHDIDMKPRI
jgi:hypothetical protein